MRLRRDYGVLRDSAALGRPHTASLTIPVALLGLVVGGASSLGLFLSVAVVALLFHYFGFLDNNLRDYAYDRADPGKQHFPLIRGTIPTERATRIWHWGTAITYFAGMTILILHAQGHNLI